MPFAKDCGSRTHNGTDVAATLYTVIESCKKVEIDPRIFINMALRLASRVDPVPTPEYARQIPFRIVNPQSATQTATA